MIQCPCKIFKRGSTKSNNKRKINIKNFIPYLRINVNKMNILPKARNKLKMTD
jgi:hypothetical protein